MNCGVPRPSSIFALLPAFQRGADLRRCSASCCAGLGSALESSARRSRASGLAPGILILTTLIFIDRAHRLAATSGITPIPMPAATIWPIASKLLSRARKRRRAPMPRGVPADMGVQRDRADQADEIALHHLAEIDLPPVRQFVAARGDQHQAIFAERDPLDIVRAARVRRRARGRRRR